MFKLLAIPFVIKLIIKRNAESAEFLEKINSSQEKVNSQSAFVSLPKYE